MCGIVGLFLKTDDMRPQLGTLLSDMLITMTDRGPDSAGVAIYGAETPGQVKITIQSDTPDVAYDGLIEAMATEIGVTPDLRRVDTHAVLTVAEADEIAARDWLMARGLRIMGAGHAMEIYKEVGLPADVTDAEAMRAAFDRFIDQTGRLDVLFNNAGIFGPMGPIDEVPLDGLDQVLNVNIRGMFIAAQLAFGQMRRQDPKGGRIINNGSVSAYVPRWGSAPYTASKHAITGLTRTLSLDGRPYDIACGQIDIGNAATEMTARMKIGVLQANGSIEAEPTFDAEHVARAVVYMAGLPLDVNVPFMTVIATQMPFVGRG